MDKDKLADIIFKAIGVGAFVGIGAIVWNFGIKEMIKDNNDLKRLLNPDSTITYSGTIWSAWKKYGEPYDIDWNVFVYGICKLNQIENEDYPPPNYKVPILINR